MVKRSVVFDIEVQFSCGGNRAEKTIVVIHMSVKISEIQKLAKLYCISMSFVASIKFSVFFIISSIVQKFEISQVM